MSEWEWAPLAKTGLKNTSKGHASLLWNWLRTLRFVSGLQRASFTREPLFLFPSFSSSVFYFLFFSPFFLLLAAVGCCCCSSDFKKEERENPGARMGKKERSYMLEEMVKDVFWGCSPQCVCPLDTPSLSLSLFLLLPLKPLPLPPQPPPTRFYWKWGYTLGFVGLKGCSVHSVVRVTPTSSSMG